MVTDPLFWDPRVKTESCPSSLIEARLNGRLVVFAGNGLSMPTNRPSWHDLVTELIKVALSEGISGEQAQAVRRLHEISRDPGHNKLAASILRDLVETQLGEGAYIRCLKTALEPLSVANAGRYHDLIANMRPTCIVTTNYDLCFERRTAEAGNEWFRVVVENEVIGSMYKMHNETVYHLHGAMDPEESMILGLTDYTRLYRRQVNAVAFLQNLFQESTVLFAGCSMTDEEILGELLASRPFNRHYALTAADSAQCALFKALGIPLSEYDCERDGDGQITSHFGLERMLSRWVRDMNNREDTGPREAAST